MPAAAATAVRPRRFGKEEPRIFTPPLRELTPETSWGFSVIEFASDVLGVDLLPWQRWLLIHMLELLPDGSLRFQTVVVLVARQNGKSTVSIVLALWFMMVMGWPLVLGTAQDLETAEEVWENAVGLLEDDEELADLIDRVVKVNGKKALVLKPLAKRRVKTRYKVKAANRRAGRGFSGNLILLDELREHQNWMAWGAITKTTQAQEFSLVFAMSNAGDITSVVLRYLRKMAHAELGDPDGICDEDSITGPSAYDVEEDGDIEDEPESWEQDESTLGIFEWSAPPGNDKWDRDGWAQANPSLGYLIRERKIAADCKTDPEAVFRTEVLCQWSDGVLDGPFQPGSWEATTNPVVEGPDGPTVSPEHIITRESPLWACVDTSHDRSQTYIVLSGFRADGVPQAEIFAARYGQDWVWDWLMDDRRRQRIVAVTGQTRGAPVSQLMKRLKEDEDFTVPVVDWAGGDLMGACGDVYDMVRDGAVRHSPQPVLDVAAATAVTKPLGEGWVLNRAASPSDIAPLMAWIGALWLQSQRVEELPPPPPPPAALESITVHGVPGDDFATIGF